MLRTTLLLLLLLLRLTVNAATQFPIVLEAENAQLFGGLKASGLSGFSGGKYVHDFSINSDSYYLYTQVDVPQAGTYEFKVFSTGTARPLYVKVNNYERMLLRTSDSPDWNAPPTSVTSVLIYMDAGANVIRIGSEFEDGPNIDKFEIHRTSAVIKKPVTVTMAFPSDITDEADIKAEHTNATLPYLTDNNETTFYEVEGANTTTITIDCKEDKVLTALLLSAGRGIDVSTWKIESSTNGKQWSSLKADSYKMTGMGDLTLFTYNHTPSNARIYYARYYRLTATGTNNKVKIGELQMFGFSYYQADQHFPADLTEGADLAKQISGSPAGNSGEGFVNLFDRNLKTKYCYTKGTSLYVQCILNKTCKISSYTLTSANDAPERDPKLWTLSGYNPEEGWVELDERTNFSFPGRYTTMKFNINSDKEFTAFMLEVASVKAGNMIQLAKLKVFGEITGNTGEAPALPENPSADPKERASELVRLMTKSEKLSYVGGINWMYTRAVPRLNIPQMKMTDGPQGVGTWGNSTAYPCGICLASTWNEELARSYGTALANDCKAEGVNILLGPAVNIHRAPMCGRNFEYMGEDPYLTSRTAVGYINGLQGNGVMSVIKHFTANFQEYNRNYISSDIDERTLNEIYFPAFRAAVQEAKTGSVMSSYNLLNGVWTTHDPWLLRTVLRDQWGFEGILMSDWGSTHACLAAAKGGLDLEMAGGERMSPDSLRYYLNQGDMDMSVIDEKVQHILQTMIKFGFMDNKQLDTSIPKDNPTSVKTALEVAREGIVLLKNQEGVLPLNTDKVKTIAVVGQNATRFLTGGGSGRVTPIHYTSFYDGIAALGKQKGVTVKFVDEYDHLDDCVFVAPGSDTNGFKGEYFNNNNLQGNPVGTRTDAKISFNFQNGTGMPGIGTSNYSMRWTGELRSRKEGDFTFTLGGDDGFRLYINNTKVIDDWNPGQERYKSYRMRLKEGEKYNLKVEYYQGSGAAIVDFHWQEEGAKDYFLESLDNVDAVIACFGHEASSEAEAGDRTFELPSKQKDFIAKVLRTQTPIIGVVTAGGNVEMQSWEPKLRSLLWAWYPGQEGGTALGEILFGDVNPSGKLPITFEKKWSDNPTFNSYYDSDGDKHVKFTEGIFMGYRGYDKLKRQVQYPFGHGLSYTTFNLSDMTVTTGKEEGTLVQVTCELKNTGKVAGAQVVQVYVGKKGESKVERPLKELKAYKKIYLKPNESQQITFSLPASAFSYFDVDEKVFVVDEGNYEISLGSSSGELLQKKEIVVKNATGIEPITAGSQAVITPTVAKAGDLITITSGVAEQVNVYNSCGMLEARYQDTKYIPTTGLAQGMYIVTMNVQNINQNGKFLIK